MCGPLGRGIHMSFILSRRAVCPHVSLQKQRILQRQKKPRRDGEAFSVCLCVRRERKSHKEGKFLWMMLYYPAKLAES